MSAEPSANGINGRGHDGRFLTGNAGGPGNPHAGKVAKLRAALVAAVSEDDIREIALLLVANAKAGDLPSIRELFDRTLGRPTAAAPEEPGEDAGRGHWWGPTAVPTPDELRRGLLEQLLRISPREDLLRMLNGTPLDHSADARRWA